MSGDGCRLWFQEPTERVPVPGPGVGGTLHKSLELLGSCWRGKPPTMPLGVARFVFTLAIGLLVLC